MGRGKVRRDMESGGAERREDLEIGERHRSKVQEGRGRRRGEEKRKVIESREKS